jgi:pilus assembly protein Flp/PilA
MDKTQTIQTLRGFLRDDGGATAIEYALIASGIAAAIIAVVLAVGTSVNGMYQNVSTSLN